MFTPDETARYARHLMLKEIGGPGQQRLKRASVALVGLGGLGAPAALYLAAAGVGALRLIDPDVVALSNLQRQILYCTADEGRPKTEAGAQRLRALNPFVQLEPIARPLLPDNAAEMLTGVDLVLDGCDSFSTRYTVNDTCHALGLPLVSGAVGRFEGQVSLFKSGLTRGLPIEERLPCYACFAPEPPPDAAHCAEMGVVGALTGVIGALMAMEAIKALTGAGDGLAGRILIYDGLRATMRTVTLRPDPHCGVCG